MVARAVLLVPRRPDITPERFKHHYEDEHIQLLQSIAGKDFPNSHIRHYVSDCIIGSAQDFPYDAFAELVFDDQDHFGRFIAATRAEDAVVHISEDEKKYLAEGQMKAFFLDDETATRRGG